MRRSNCLVFAWCAWRRWHRRPDCYFALRDTRHLRGWHWLVEVRGHKIAFEPFVYFDSWLFEAVAMLWYRGSLRWGDARRDREKVAFWTAVRKDVRRVCSSVLNRGARR